MIHHWTTLMLLLAVLTQYGSTCGEADIASCDYNKQYFDRNTCICVHCSGVTSSCSNLAIGSKNYEFTKRLCDGWKQDGSCKDLFIQAVSTKTTSKTSTLNIPSSTQAITRRQDTTPNNVLAPTPLPNQTIVLVSGLPSTNQEKIAVMPVITIFIVASLALFMAVFLLAYFKLRLKIRTRNPPNPNNSSNVDLEAALSLEIFTSNSQASVVLPSASDETASISDSNEIRSNQPLLPSAPSFDPEQQVIDPTEVTYDRISVSRYPNPNNFSLASGQPIEQAVAPGSNFNTAQQPCSLSPPVSIHGVKQELQQNVQAIETNAAVVNPDVPQPPQVLQV